MNWQKIVLISLITLHMSGLSGVFAQDAAQETEELDFAEGLLSRGMYDMAVSEYEKFITNHPQSTYIDEANLAIGEAYFLAQDYPKAIDAFNRFKTAYPNSDKLSSAILRLGQIYIDQNKYDDAIKELTSIDFETRLKGDALQSFYFYLSKAYRSKADMPSALSYLDKAAVTNAPTNLVYVFQEIADIHAQQKEYKEAADAFTKALAASQDDNQKAYFTYKLGETQFLLGNYADAVPQFRQIISQFASSELVKDALANLLLAQFNLGHFDELIMDYQNNTALIKEDGAYFDIHFAAAKSLIELKKYDEAIALMDKIVAFPSVKDEDKRRIMIAKARILIDQKKFQDALTILEGTLPGQTADADQISFLKGQAYFGLANFDKASQAYQDIKTNYPQSDYVKAASLGLAHSYEELGKFKEAGDFFNEHYVGEQDEQLKGESLYYAALMLSKSDNNDQAIAKAEEYIKAFSQGAYYEQSVFLLGDLYAKTKQYDKAVTLLNTYLAHPENVKRLDAAYFLLGYNQELAGQSEQALEAYNKVPLNKEDPKFYASALKNSAVIYLSQNKEDQALVAFDKLITDVDKNFLELKSYLWLCAEYLKAKKFNDVLRVAQLAEKYFPDQGKGEIAYFKGEGYRELKDAANALLSYDLVLSLPEKNVYTGAAHIGKGLTLMDTNKLDEATAEFQKAIDENPDDHTITLRARYEIANIANTQQKYEEALKFYLLVGTIYEDDIYCPESMLRAGAILENLNRKDEAKKLYEEILQKYKETPAANQAKEKIAAIK
jgi:tetratricopeptide (TPR) repeat protein